MQRRYLLCCALISLGMSGCGGGSKHSSEEHYYLIAANTQVGYWQTAAAGLIDSGKQMEITAEITGPKTYDPQDQHQQFLRIIDKKPTGILVSASDPKLLGPDIDAAIAAGIPVITIDSDAPASKRLLFVGTNNYQAGRLGAEALAKKLNGKGNVAVFTMPTQPNLVERLHGYRSVIADYPGMKIAEVIDVKGDSRMAFDAAEEIIEKRKDKIDAFVSLESLSGKEIADVLARRKVENKTVIAMDTDKETLEWIRKGVIDATVGQKPYTMAYYGLKMLDDLYHHKVTPLDKKWSLDPRSQIPNFVDTGLSLIDKSNVAAFQQGGQ